MKPFLNVATDSVPPGEEQSPSACELAPWTLCLFFPQSRELKSTETHLVLLTPRQPSCFLYYVL